MSSSQFLMHKYWDHNAVYLTYEQDRGNPWGFKWSLGVASHTGRNSKAVHFQMPQWGRLVIKEAICTIIEFPPPDSHSHDHEAFWKETQAFEGHADQNESINRCKYQDQNISSAPHIEKLNLLLFLSKLTAVQVAYTAPVLTDCTEIKVELQN